MSSISLGEPANRGRRLAARAQIRLEKTITVGPAASEPEVMIQKRQVLPGQLPGDPAALSHGVEIDHEELGLFGLIEPHQDVAGMKVVVQEPGVVQPGGHRAPPPGPVSGGCCDRSGSGHSGSRRSTNSSSGIVSEIAGVTR